MDKVALVSGSTSNIGKAVAEMLSRREYQVVVTSRNEAEAKVVAESLPRRGSHYRVDFSDPRSIDELFAFLKSNFKRLDVLVNNVAFTRNESILECDLATWETTINTNLRSYYLCTKLAAEMMKEQGGGNIVNITVSSTRGMQSKFSYLVAKGGVNWLTMCSALDLAPFNIRVNAVGSGMVGTAVGYRDYTNRPHDNPRIPAGHIGEPEDVAAAVGFLISDEARYVLGATLPVDGGLSIQG